MLGFPEKVWGIEREYTVCDLPRGIYIKALRYIQIEKGRFYGLYRRYFIKHYHF